LCDPPLSSVALPGKEVGRAAAELLDRLMAGEAAPAAPVRIAPHTLVPRGSTDAFGWGDTRMAEIVPTVREGAEKGGNVAALADRVGLSRRQLERRVKNYLGVTPLLYLSRVRVERAKSLLQAPGSATLSEVAEQCGFTDARRFKAVFR